MLELYATEGLNPRPVHHGAAAARPGPRRHDRARARGRSTCPTRRSHPAFAYLPETGEEIYNSFLGVPVLRAGRTLGVLVVQNRTKRTYSRGRGRGARDHGDGDRRDDRRRRSGAR
ncbi:MAG: GAF domain-containing protein [Nocardioides sp.]